MITLRQPSRLFAVLALLFTVALPSLAAAEKATPNDVARMLAGMAPAATSPLATLTSERSWQAHARVFDQAWKGLDQRQISRIRHWSETNLPVRRPVMFYMFSGPDFLYANALLPGASTYVLSGLEPVGRIPELSPTVRRSLPQTLQSLRGSMNSILNYSFFKTKDMRVQLAGGTLNGTLPVIYVFMARSGMTIHEVDLIKLANDGAVSVVGSADVATGARIAFSSGDGPKQTLYYFQTDLSNHGVKNSGFLKCCELLGVGDSLVKSASYLMHSDSFSTVREFLLTRSQVLLQDDSGVPIRYFEQDDWNLRPYGKYLGPIALFAGQNQPQLGQLFRKSAQRIDFGIGYRWRSQESNLLLATKKSQTAAQTSETAAPGR